MSALAALTSSLLFYGFTIAAIVAPDGKDPSGFDWTWVRSTMDFSDLLSIVGRLPSYTTLSTKVRA
jgi:hypothetical protein